MNPKLYALIALMEAEELNALCQQDNHDQLSPAPPAQSAISLVPTGFGIDGIETTGRSAGTLTVPMEADVGQAASRLASAAVTQTSRPRKRRTLSQNTI